ncbi:unnamed protein product [Closterium sp. Yama58-4]|nr:unnamed protein product [Closterium sp. Yama58-4]
MVDVLHSLLTQHALPPVAAAPMRNDSIRFARARFRTPHLLPFPCAFPWGSPASVPAPPGPVSAACSSSVAAAVLGGPPGSAHCQGSSRHSRRRRDVLVSRDSTLAMAYVLGSALPAHGCCGRGNGGDDKARKRAEGRERWESPPSLPAGGTIGATVKDLCVLTFSVEDNHFVIVLALSTAVVRIFCNRGVFHIAVVAELEACVQKIDLNNMDEEMADKEPAENSSAKDPAAAENSKEQERESQGDDIELEGEEDILHAEIAKLQDHAAEQDTRIQQQQSLISTLRGELSDQDNKIKYLEVELKNMKHDAREQGHQLARQTSKINDLREAFNALRRETMYRPAPRADPPANSASGRTNPSRSGGAVGDPGPSTQRAAEPSTQAFGSLPITLPPFIHGKTDVAAWLSMMTDLFKAHKVQDDARVVAATTVLDQNAQRVVYGSKIQAEADRKPFGGLPEHLKNMHMTDGAGEAWRSYDHVKRVVGTTDKHFRAYAKTTTQPQQTSRPSSSTAGPSGMQQGTPWKGGNHKRPFQQGQQADHKAKKVNEGGPSNVQSCFKCGKPGHKGYECRHRKAVKYSGKAKTDNKRNDGSGPSGSQRDFAKPN